MRFCLFSMVIFLLAALAACSRTYTGSSTAIPRLQKQGTATQLMVDGKPFLVLGAELHNSSASNLAYLKPVWPRLKAMRINTVLTPVYWEFLEPKEGQFDFTLVDGQIREARSHDLRLVFLWFGSWKNSMSSYVPDWVKTNQERFPRAQDKDGQGIEALSTLSAANRDADAKAFAALMRHIREADTQRRVIMIQVENEVGRMGDTRDRSEAANKAFEGPVPKELLDYLSSHKDTLYPGLRKAWEAAGSRTSGTWEQVLGKGARTEESFMAWNYATYLNQVAAAGKAEYPLPMFVNAFPSASGREPGMYPSGGPVPEVADIWKAGAPAIDILTPNSYDPNVVDLWARYHTSNNPLFVPEIGAPAGAHSVFYALGQHEALGFSPFAIDSLAMPSGPETPGGPVALPIARSYAILEQLAPLILENQGKGKLAGALVSPDDPPQRVPLGNYVLEVSYARMRRPPLPAPPKPAGGGPPAMPAPAPATVPAGGFPGGAQAAERAGALFISLGPDEYIAAGSGPVSVTFAPSTPGPPRAGILSIDEGAYAGGRWIPGRRLNGDENGQGQFLRLSGPAARNGSILRVKLYRYR
ncbi:MAG: DUF5597 domain-containing protein [Bryobacterales bacterium]|nr:DUF5597 domain-containing protein [Bryobacterales bacterium]